MALGPMIKTPDLLAPRRFSRLREHDVLRVAALIPHGDDGANQERARREVLTWAQKRSGGQMPKEAWDGQSFEYFAAGRNTMGVRILAEGNDLWALRGEDPDKIVAGRNWTTEVTIGRGHTDETLLSLRLIASTPEDTLDIEPHVPGLLQQMSSKCGLQVGSYSVKPTPWCIESRSDVDQLIAMLEDTDRLLPIFVASGDERSNDPARPLIECNSLSRAVLGLAHVIVLPSTFTYGLSEAFGKVRSVFHGAVRAYMPGFDASANPYDHRLIIAGEVQKDPGGSTRYLRCLAASESLRRTRLGRDVLSFVTVRSEALKIEQESRAEEEAGEASQLDATEKRLRALESELVQSKSESDEYANQVDLAEERAKTAEAQLYYARDRIQVLQSQAQSRGQVSDIGVALPPSWADFADWCDRNLFGQVILAPAARRGVKLPEFADVNLVCRCLLWLAASFRNIRIKGGGKLANTRVEDGIWNAPCGTDSYFFDFQGRRLEANWHIKSGGNTRDPARCLRIYYAWDDSTEQVVVADMPAHRSSGAT